MTKRPNKLGRIEGEPKVRWYKKTNWSVIGKTLLVVGLVALGVLGTLQYQKTINNIKAEGVAEHERLARIDELSEILDNYDVEHRGGAVCLCLRGAKGHLHDELKEYIDQSCNERAKERDDE